MSRRDNTKARCLRCRAHQSLCFCAQIPRISTRTRLVLLVHYKEWRKPTNTGFLAVESLANSEFRARGYAGQPEGGLALDSTIQPLLLYPSDDASPIREYRNSPKPIWLIVPDGNWRQAGKMRHRVPGLDAVPVVTLPGGTATEYRLRHEHREDGLATIEAIARAFGELEGASVQSSLEGVFRIMVERALWSRGKLADHQVSGGIPSGVLRHDPLSGSRS